MDPNTVPNINGLLARFAELHERWESEPDAFDWSQLQSLAHEGAHAYNEQAGPSFHSLALDGVQHSIFHERFLDYSIGAGFDPFRLVTVSSPQAAPLPVIAHDSLADAALTNPVSARMHESLIQLARAKFSPLIEQDGKDSAGNGIDLYQVFQVCAESIPLDLLERVVPEMAEHARKRDANRSLNQNVNPEEAYLSSAEAIVDSRRPYG